MSSPTISLAQTLEQAGNLSEAMAVYEKLVARDKKNADVLIRGAILALKQGNRRRARQWATRVLHIEPKAAVAHNILGIAAAEDHAPTAAIKHFERALALSPGDVQVTLNLVELYNHHNRSEDALALLDMALDGPGQGLADLHYRRGVTLRALGRDSAAIAAFRQTLALANSPHGGAWKALAEMQAIDLSADRAALDRAIEALDHDPASQANVMFAYFLAHEGQKEYDEAFSWLARANETYRSSYSYDIASDEAFLTAIARAFSPQTLDRLSGLGVTSKKPIFIFGMPRSGTTLVEQILAGHDDVIAGGELLNMEIAVNSVGSRPNFQYPEIVGQWKKRDIQNMAKHYLDALTPLGPADKRITDKIPENFIFLGLIKALFPNAAVIHCVRDPIDTCLGNYRQLFSSGHLYAQNLDELIRYYKAYQGLMAHWRTVLGTDAFIEVQYEELVQDQKRQLERILKHCGLDWSDGCLQIQETNRAVFTASASQVRNGIHTNYVARWKRYERHIGPLIEAFPPNR